MIRENPHREPVGEDCRSRRFRCGSARDELGSNVRTIHLGIRFRFPFRGEARVLLSSPRTSNATDTRSLLRDPSVVRGAKGAAAQRQTSQETDGAAPRFARILISGLKKPPLI